MGNEITVKLTTSIKELCDMLKSKDFKVRARYLVDDTYFIPKSLNIEGVTPRDILKKAVLLRDITEYLPSKKEIKKFTFKRKEIDEEGNILNQDKVDCEIFDLEKGVKFLETIEFKKLMRIREFDETYEKNGLEIIVKNVENGDEMLEIEFNDKYDSVEKIKKEIKALEIPIDTSNYFVKKAEIELEKILKEKKEIQIGE